MHWINSDRGIKQRSFQTASMASQIVLVVKNYFNALRESNDHLTQSSLSAVRHRERDTESERDTQKKREREKERWQLRVWISLPASARHYKQWRFEFSYLNSHFTPSLLINIAIQYLSDLKVAGQRRQQVFVLLNVCEGSSISISQTKTIDMIFSGHMYIIRWIKIIKISMDDIWLQ